MKQEGQINHFFLCERCNSIVPQVSNKSHLCLTPEEAKGAGATTKDVVNNPEHYTKGGLEVIDIMKAKMSAEEFEGFLKGNVWKYTMRYKFKNGLEDLKKAQVYLNRLIDLVQSTK